MLGKGQLKRWVRWSFLWGSAAWMMGCSNPHQETIKELQALADSVELELVRLEEPSEENVVAAYNWADSQLREFELLLEGGLVTVSKSEGQIISEVSRARRLLKDQAKRRLSLPKSAERATMQLRGLADAIASQNPKDAAGTPIDDVYIERETALEMGIARDVIDALEETQELATRGISIEQAIHQQCDSLQTVCRSRLAQAILGSDSNPASE